MQKPASAPWHVALPASDLAKLMRGLIPREMEDKWFCYADGPDADGNLLFRLCRSWTGAEIYVLHLRAPSEAGDAEVTQITWEDRGDGEAAAKQMAAELCRALMDCKFAVS
ncbi:hypothetical protein HRG_002845 [Hirsutella rhossiliensis]|uniref:Uncharacterized protein n=1 Tax=Hirsutella rhossiliensis TaxID=111463 RepID=A0A9P8N2U4_9HYPO|nr:uncharacterized protein HRG_02845 [Hirsutella rhossiliensis]KAH0964829.1 hypothetical protein HRG_02845 [Hirsutella rhossiliensis]